MSRICVKNLPRKCTETRLREHFAAQGGEITDVRIMRKVDGSSRMFGFVGFKTDKMASAARNYFDNTFIGTVKIAVELAKKRGDEELARPWSKHSKGSSAFELVAKRTGEPAADSGVRARTKPGEERARADDDPKLREYLALMRPKGSAGKFWASDGDMATPTEAEVAAAGKGEGSKLKATSKQLRVPNRKPGGEGLVVTKTHVTFVEEAAESDDDDYQSLAPGGAGPGAAEAQSGAQHALAGLSDLEYLRSKQRPDSLSDGEDEDEATADEQAEAEAEGEGEGDPSDAEAEAEVEASAADPDARADAEEQEEGAPPLDGADLSESGRLFVRNLAFDVSEAEFTQLLRKFGPLADVHVPVDPTSKRGKGFAYAQFMLPEHAVRAMSELDGSIFQGRLLHLLPAQQQRATKAAPAEGAGGTFKAHQEAQRRASAQQPVGWNSLFMGADAVAAATAEGLGLTKSALLGPDADDAAVRLALGETSLLGATKQWFRTHGLNASALDALDAAREAAADAGKADIARSRTVLLVKNLPARVSEQLLHGEFSRYGSITRLLLPPARTLALIEYSAIPEARRAFAGMAYRKLGEGLLPLYLEWAPQALLEPPDEEGDARAAGAAGAEGGGAAGGGASSADTESEAEAEAEAEVARGTGPVAQQKPRPARAAATGPALPGPERAAAAPVEEADDAQELEAGSGRSVFVKNLNFKTDEAALRELFGQRFSGYPLTSVLVARKTDRKQPGKQLSLGYGFVEFASREHASEVLKALAPGHKPLILHEHTLALSLSAPTHGAKLQPAQVARAAERRASAPKGKPSRKLTVRNVPFEASKKELYSLFSAFGELQSVRVPKKFDGKHRGFAFVEYLSKQDAAKAMEALGNTHLYGRHLVLEWAADEQSLDALRDKAKRNLDGSQRAADAKRLRARDEAEFDREGATELDDQMLY